MDHHSGEHGGLNVFDVKKLVEGILAFVNFFVVRIAVACFVAGLIYKMSGQYYFDLGRDYISSSPFSELDVKLYIEKASVYVADANVKNAIFVVALIVCLSMLDILYRAVGKLGSLFPVMMLHDYRPVTNWYRPEILKSWRRYAKQYEPLGFITMVEEKASAERRKTSIDRWWNTLFRYSKSFIVILFIVYILTPRAALKVSLFDVLFYAALALICMAVSTAIESARVTNDISSALGRKNLSRYVRARLPHPFGPSDRFCNGCLGGGAGSMSQGLGVFVFRK
jgi:hypothetical protein